MKIYLALFAFLLAGFAHHAALADDFDTCSIYSGYQDQCQSAGCSWIPGSCGVADGGEDSYGCWSYEDESSCEDSGFNNSCSWSDGTCYSTDEFIARPQHQKPMSVNSAVGR